MTGADGIEGAAERMRALKLALGGEGGGWAVSSSDSVMWQSSAEPHSWVVFRVGDLGALTRRERKRLRHAALRALGSHQQWSWRPEKRQAVLGAAARSKTPWQRARRRPRRWRWVIRPE